MTTFTSAFLRALVAAGLPMTVLWILESRLNPEQGPDIGGGFFLTLTLFFLPLTWAWRDGRHRGPRTALTVWGAASGLVLLTGLARFMTSGGFNVSDTGEVFFLAAFLTAPFLAGGCFGALLGGGKYQAQQHL